MKVFAVLVLFVLVSACDGRSASPPIGTFAVEGFVHAGPTCPVMRQPPDPACADRGVAGAALHVLDAGGDIIVTVATDDDGRFTTSLAAGSFTLVPQPVDGLLGTGQPVAFTVGNGPIVLEVVYDTGIR